VKTGRRFFMGERLQERVGGVMEIKHLERALEIKALGESGLFVGYASVFGEKDSHNEIVEKGAFKKSLVALREKGRVPAMLWMHDPTAPIGIWLTLYEDENGLAVQGRLALSTQKGREAYELMKMKALTGLSIGYRVVSSKIDKRRKARVLTDVELFEISLVTFPSNDAARVREVKAPVRKVIKRKQKTSSKSKGKKTSDKAMTAAMVARLNRAARKLSDDKVGRKKA
jgi:HK97 family phage prohead protease